MFSFSRILSQQKFEFLKVERESSNDAFYVSYGENKRFQEFEFSTASLVFLVFGGTKNSNFQKWNGRAQNTRFMFVPIITLIYGRRNIWRLG